MGHSEQFKWNRHEIQARSPDAGPMRPHTGAPAHDAELLARATSIRASLMAYHPDQALGLRLMGQIG